MLPLIQKAPVAHSFEKWTLPRHLGLCAVALASLFASDRVLGQGPYYPVSNPGGPYGATYTNLTVLSDPFLSYLQTELQTVGANLTLENPVPATKSAPLANQLATATSLAIEGYLNGTAPTAVLNAPNALASLSTAAVGYNLSFRQTTATAIAQGIIQVDYTANNNPAQAISDLASVSQGLAIAQPADIASILPPILSQAGTVAFVALGIPQIVTAAINQIPTDNESIASIVEAGTASIANSVLPPTQKTSLFATSSTSYIKQVMQSSAANNNPSVIETITALVTNNSYSSLASLNQILNAAAHGLPVQNNATLIAITAGALSTQGNLFNGPSNVQSGMAAAAPSYASETAQVVGGYTNTSTAAILGSYIATNAAYADAITAGAVVKGSLATATVLQVALTNGTGASGVTPDKIVYETILRNPNAAPSTALAAINTSTHQPYGYPYPGVGATLAGAFGEIALGAAEAAPLEQMNSTIVDLVAYSASSNSNLNTAIVNSIVSNAIDGATNSNNPGAYAAIVYAAEVVARNTSGASGGPTGLVATAINEIQADGGLPYIAAVAAAAGDAYGVNHSAIKSASDTALAVNPTYQTAADQGMALVQAFHTSSATKYAATLNAMNIAQATGGDAVRAVLYAAIMANPNEYDAGLAASLKLTPANLASETVPITDAVLTGDANYAIIGIIPGDTQDLETVDAVFKDIQNEALGQGPSHIVDLFAYVTKQIVLDSSLTFDITIAANVVDPDHAHYVAHAVAFQTPMTVYDSAAAIYEYTQITNPSPLAVTNSTSFVGSLPTGKTFPGSLGKVIDQPAAAAAITAAMTTGILEANLSTANTQTALSTAILEAVESSIYQNGAYLQGPPHPFNYAGDTGKIFQQSNGGTYSGATTPVLANAVTVGPAGAITGFIAEVTTPGQSSITSMTQAVLTAAAGGGARPYALQMAQAAGQAFAWVSGYSTAPTVPVGSAPGNPVYDIANAMAGDDAGFDTLTQLENAVAFGIYEAQQGVIGAGALGLNGGNPNLTPGTPGSGSLNTENGSVVIAASGNPNSSFYIHRSALGTPVIDIFDL